MGYAECAIKDVNLAKVFVCYSRKDESFSNRLVADLNAAAISTWRDIDDIPKSITANEAGWRQAIQSALDDCSHMVVILSPDAVISHEVEAEWNYFLKSKRPVFPVLYRDCTIPYRLDVFQAWNLQRDYAAQLNGLKEALSSTNLPFREIEVIDDDYIQNLYLQSRKVSSAPAIKLHKYILRYVRTYGHTPSFKQIYTDLNWQGLRVTRRRLRYLQEAGLLTVDASDQIHLSSMVELRLDQLDKQLFLMLSTLSGNTQKSFSYGELKNIAANLGYSEKILTQRIEYYLTYDLLKKYKTKPEDLYTLTLLSSRVIQVLANKS